MALGVVIAAPGRSVAQRGADHQGLMDFERQALDDTAPGPGADWEWGELLYGAMYMTHLLIKNDCRTYEFVELYASDGVAAFLDAPERFLAHPNSITHLNMIIVTPSDPTAPPPQDDAGAGQSSPYMAQWQEIKGRVLVKHSDESNFCIGGLGLYDVYGHIHRMPGSGDGSLCVRYWLAGRMPDNPALDCTEVFRELAQHYVEITLNAYVESVPAEWSWLPDEQTIATMNAEELLAMKNRAEQQRLAPSPGDAALSTPERTR
jgi:hypothetical protein